MKHIDVVTTEFLRTLNDNLPMHETVKPFPGKYPTRVGYCVQQPFWGGKQIFKYVGVPSLAAYNKVRKFTEGKERYKTWSFNWEFDQKGIFWVGRDIFLNTFVWDYYYPRIAPQFGDLAGNVVAYNKFNVQTVAGHRVYRIVTTQMQPTAAWILAAVKLGVVFPKDTVIAPPEEAI